MRKPFSARGEGAPATAGADEETLPRGLDEFRSGFDWFASSQIRECGRDVRGPRGQLPRKAGWTMMA
jgi:hypothetical protein